MGRRGDLWLGQVFDGGGELWEGSGSLDAPDEKFPDLEPSGRLFPLLQEPQRLSKGK